MGEDTAFMRRCLHLARKGLGTAAPNPMVGCVIAYRGKVIGEGWHRCAGLPHAEANAISAVSDRSLLRKSTLYVNLEPCVHYGKTPPCADLIIASGIPQVVIAMRDPFVKVDGRGIQKLQNAGIEVTVGTLEAAALELNKRFLTFHQKKRPYIILKWAQTRDGFIDKVRDTAEIRQNWISNPQSKQLVHRWRSQEQAILVGTHTIRHDNPKLTTRLWDGANPLRVVLDRNLEIDHRAAIFSTDAHTLVFTEKKACPKRNDTAFIQTQFKSDLIEKVLAELYARSIQSIAIEGGRFTIDRFISKNLWDEARIFIGDKRFKDGLKAPGLNGNLIAEYLIQSDIVRIYKPIATGIK